MIHQLIFPRNSSFFPGPWHPLASSRFFPELQILIKAMLTAFRSVPWRLQMLGGLSSLTINGASECFNGKAMINRFWITYLIGGSEHFSTYWESSSHLTNIFQRVWNHQPEQILDKLCSCKPFAISPLIVSLAEVWIGWTFLQDDTQYDAISDLDGWMSQSWTMMSHLLLGGSSQGLSEWVIRPRASASYSMYSCIKRTLPITSYSLGDKMWPSGKWT